MSKHSSYLLISNVWNEEGNLESVFKQVSQQTCQPTFWLIINDGSTDNSLKELEQLSSKNFNTLNVKIHSLRRKTKGNLDTLGIAIRTSLKTIPDTFDYYAKLDIDTLLPVDYFERIFVEFQKDPSLVCASGAIYYNGRKEPNNRGWARGSGLTIRGWFFDYYRNQIPEITLETWIGTLARIHGYKTLEIPQLKEIQLKPTTQLTSAGTWRRGKLAYFFGMNFLVLVLRLIVSKSLFRQEGKDMLQGYFFARKISWKISNKAIRHYWFSEVLIEDFKRIFKKTVSLR